MEAPSVLPRRDPQPQDDRLSCIGARSGPGAPPAASPRRGGGPHRPGRRGDGGAGGTSRAHRPGGGRSRTTPRASLHTIRNTADAPVTYVMFKWQADPRQKPGLLEQQVIPVRRGHPDRVLRLSRRLLEGETACLRRLHSHLTTLQPGAGYDPHVDAHDVAIVVLEGDAGDPGRTGRAGQRRLLRGRRIARHAQRGRRPRGLPGLRVPRPASAASGLERGPRPARWAPPVAGRGRSEAVEDQVARVRTRSPARRPPRGPATSDRSSGPPRRTAGRTRRSRTGPRSPT